MDEIKLNGESLDIVSDNVSKLKEIFPEVITEDKIDFDKLKLILGSDIDTDSERYSFTWPGKTQAIKESQKQSTGTLRPCKEESKNWDTTKNLYIEGDNLEVLKLLQKGYYNKIKAIYIDPPYNTGNDFIYSDDYSDNIENYLQITGQKIGEKRISTNTDSDGRFHSNWLNMMYPRLKLARNLLTDDGAIFISIDEKESDKLKKICDEIFGEENFRNQILVRRRVKSLNLQFSDKGLNSFNVGTEYIFVYSKTPEFLFNPLRMKKKNASNKGKWNVFWSNADRPTMRYELLGFTPSTGQWRWSKELAYEAVENYKKFENEFSNKMSLEEYWISTGRKLKFIRRLPNKHGKNGGVQYWVGPSDTSLRTSNWTDIEVSQIAKDYDLPFENPKNVDLIKTVISAFSGNSFTVLDFFSGSATTADAVFRLNLEDNGNRNFIMIQLPQNTSDNSDARKMGFNTICDVGKERIRLAGKRIVDENCDEERVDTGFKVFKLDSSNFKKWAPDYENLEKTLDDFADNINEVDRTSEDLIYEIMLKYGIDLTLPIEEYDAGENKIYSIGFGALLICLDNKITKDITDSIIELASEDVSRVVFKDNGFASDADKTNIKETLRTHDIDEFITI
ncbi:site-specific DNA-methyltransferase [uncultured Methanobrevibacter sp.]|uniref:site-specific DNA-methyltransferase n=1 Tax=uncultured Methanobrevibacter sp. TaxID=253161 RepID=UPI0025EAD19E|nr:site-specific DNA-methyltransferase [uncultured Methanobrevibacter sp.]